MPYTNWSDGLNNLLHECNDFREMWQSVVFRVLGRQIPNSNHMKIVICNIQATPTKMTAYSQVSITTPLVMEGAADFEEFVALLTAWVDDELGTLAGFVFERPDIEQLDWDPNIVEDGLYNPLLIDLPSFQSKYRFHRLTGGGHDQDNDTETEVHDLCRELGQRRDEWMMDYLSVNVSPVIRPYLSVILPVSVGLNTTFTTESRQCKISLAYKPPLSKDHFWIRMSSGKWQSSLPVHQPKDKIEVDDWRYSTLEYQLPSGEALNDLNIWVGRMPTSRPFEWVARIEVEKPRTPVEGRQHFLQTWYNYAGQQIGKHAQKQEVGTKGKSGAVQDQFEIVIANTFSALGCSVFFGGTVLKTPGIDLVAFNSNEVRVYVLSVTVSNDLDKKLRTLLTAIEDLKFSLEGWLISPFIVSLESANTFLHNDIINAREAGVVLLSGEDLEPLREEPPDLHAIQNILASGLQTLTIHKEHNMRPLVPGKF